MNVYAGLEPPHDSSNNITCNDCHSISPDIPWGFLPRDEYQENMCKSCHNPTGQAASLYNVANHSVNGGAMIVDCGSCHNAHYSHVTTDPHDDSTSINLKLIRMDTAKYILGALEPAIYQVNPDDYSFDTAPYNGICQTCH